MLRAWRVPPRPWAPKLLSPLDGKVAFGAQNPPKPKKRMVREQVRRSGILERVCGRSCGAVDVSAISIRSLCFYVAIWLSGRPRASHDSRRNEQKVVALSNSNLQFPISDFQIPISKFQFPISNFQCPISNSNFFRATTFCSLRLLSCDAHGRPDSQMAT